MDVWNELELLAAARPRISQASQEAVSAAEENRILRQILATSAEPGPAGDRHERPVPRRRAGLQAGGLGIAGAAAAAAVLAASGVTATPGPGSPAPRQHAAPGSARQILLAAATAAAAAPAGSGRYWYTQTTTAANGHRETDDVWSNRSGSTLWIWAGKKTHGQVIKMTGSPGFMLGGDPGVLQMLQTRQGKPQRVSAKPLPPNSPPSGKTGEITFAQLQQLPTGTAALKAWIVTFNRAYQRELGLHGVGNLMVFQSLMNLVADLPAPPRVRAAAFRVMATLPGVTALGPVPGGQGLRLALGSKQYATLVVDIQTSQARGALTVTGASGQTGSMSTTGRWANQVP